MPLPPSVKTRSDGVLHQTLAADHPASISVQSSAIVLQSMKEEGEIDFLSPAIDYLLENHTRGKPVTNLDALIEQVEVAILEEDIAPRKAEDARRLLSQLINSGPTTQQQFKRTLELLQAYAHDSADNATWYHAGIKDADALEGSAIEWEVQYLYFLLSERKDIIGQKNGLTEAEVFKRAPSYLPPELVKDWLGQADRIKTQEKARKETMTEARADLIASIEEAVEEHMPLKAGTYKAQADLFEFGSLFHDEERHATLHAISVLRELARIHGHDLDRKPGRH